jgi:hypothetical protein
MGDNKKKGDKALPDIKQEVRALLEVLAHTLLVVRVNGSQNLVCVCTSCGNKLLGGCSHPHSSLALQGSSLKCLHDEAEDTVGLGENGRVLSSGRMLAWNKEQGEILRHTAQSAVR